MITLIQNTKIKYDVESFFYARCNAYHVYAFNIIYIEMIEQLNRTEIEIIYKI